MHEFLKVRSSSLAFAEIEPRLSSIRDSETLPTVSALGRIVADDILSPEDLPSFRRSSMDGYSVRARDTFGASESLPALLEVVGDIPTGEHLRIALAPGETSVAYTGGMLAENADAVVMFERTQPADKSSIEVLRPVAPGENVIQVGEDLRSGDRILPRGHRLRPQDIGGLLAVGITNVSVVRRPRVAIVSTGDELLVPNEQPPPGRIRDINTYTISARVVECGGEPILLGLAPDEYESQLDLARKGIEQADALIFSAGSSLSTRDLTARVFDELGKPGVLAHGISIKPGKPTIVGFARGKSLFGLPGNPVSALVVFDLLVAPAIRALSGVRASISSSEPNHVEAVLSANLPSESGREDYVPVRLSKVGDIVSASPVFGKSNLIYTLIDSDGIVSVPPDSGGLYAGEVVSVRLC